MNTYECFYKGVRKTVEADTSYGAQKKYCAENGVKPKDGYKVMVILAAKGGVEVVHNTGEIG